MKSCATQIYLLRTLKSISEQLYLITEQIGKTCNIYPNLTKIRKLMKHLELVPHLYRFEIIKKAYLNMIELKEKNINYNINEF